MAPQIPSFDAPLIFSGFADRLAPPAINRLMSLPLEDPSILSLAAGFTDNLTLPSELVKNTVHDLTERFPDNEFLQYGTIQGRPGLRQASAHFLTRHPNEAPEAWDPSHFFVTNGSQQALFLAMRTLCDPGDIVLVQDPTYFVFLSMLQGMDVQAIGMPSDPQGHIDLIATDHLLGTLIHDGQRRRIKAVYIMGYHANPSTRSMELPEKEGLAKLLRAHNLIIPVIEDAAYRELFYREPHPVPSVFSIPSFGGFPLLYLGTYTKPLATGLKVGYGVCNHTPWRESMLYAKGNQDFGTSNFTQAIVEQILLDNNYAPLLQKLAAHYRRKADLLNKTLVAGGLPERGWQWTPPNGGLLFWLKAPELTSTSVDSPLCQACQDKGVIYVPGDLCFASGKPHHFLRLSLGSLPNEKLETAAVRLCDAIRTL